MKTIFFAILFLAITSISCNKDTSPLSSTPDGAFEYQSFDTSGTQIISGWIDIDLADTNNIQGNWKLSKIGDPPNIGHQVGEGSLDGSIKNKNIYINLNPGIADDNVILNGILKNKTIEGHWYYSTFVGAINGGNFKAVKK